MKRKLTMTLSAGAWAILLLAFYAVQAQTPATPNQSATKQGNAAPPAAASTVSATTAAVSGSGTSGQITKWLGSNSTGYVLGDSTISEDKYGKVGIGTTTPTSKLTVQGLIETTLGGFKFPDGTVQTTAALNGLQSVFHNTTLIGNGTAGSPLGVTVPLELSGASNQLILLVQNTGSGPAVAAQGGASSNSNGGGDLRSFGGNSTTASGGRGLSALGGDSNGFVGGDGVSALGGRGNSHSGGKGVATTGGNSISGDGGEGVSTTGGNSDSGFGGDGARALGGNSSSNAGGNGVSATGGDSNNGNGGRGVVAQGGLGSGAGKSGGSGFVALGGPGINGATGGPAGVFVGDVQVTGNLSKGGGSFKIDHPLDPENKYLYHSFVESPDMKNIYDGLVVLDANGEALVELPEWFETLNKDFRYLLTAVGAPGPMLYIAVKINKNHFKIAGGQPGMEVSWQVTGIRQDNWANQHRIPVEEQKPEIERGHYLHPEVFNQPEEKSVEWVRNPELMKRMKNLKEQSQLKQP